MLLKYYQKLSGYTFAAESYQVYWLSLIFTDAIDIYNIYIRVITGLQCWEIYVILSCKLEPMA
jgi:tetrahydromethanopterin S-methyltransferase subunit E